MNSDKVLAWIMPVLLVTAVGVLSWMATNLNHISESLAVVVYRIQDHENRLERLEQHDKF